MTGEIDKDILLEQVKKFIIDKAKSIKDDALYRARLNCPIDKGNLQMSLVGDVDVHKDYVYIWIGSTLPYAKYVEYCRFSGWTQCEWKQPSHMWPTKRDKMEHNLSNPSYPLKVNSSATVPFMRPALWEAIKAFKK